jgi:hypothetical protein
MEGEGRQDAQGYPKRGGDELTTLRKSVVESAAPAWLKGLGWAVKHGPEVAPGELVAERPMGTAR